MGVGAPISTSSLKFSWHLIMVRVYIDQFDIIDGLFSTVKYSSHEISENIAENVDKHKQISETAYILELICYNSVKGVNMFKHAAFMYLLL